MSSSGKSDGRRLLRFEKALRLEIANFLLTGIKVELDCLISVARVHAARDLKSARVYLSVMGSDEQQEQVLEKVRAARVPVQNHIAHALKMRFCPLLSFYLDEGIEQVLKVERILHELEKERRGPKAKTSGLEENSL